MAPRLGFEPRYTAPEAVVLPLDDPAICWIGLTANTTTSLQYIKLRLFSTPLATSNVWYDNPTYDRSKQRRTEGTSRPPHT